MARTMKIRPGGARLYFEDDDTIKELPPGQETPLGGGTVFHINPPSLQDVMNMKEASQDPQKLGPIAARMLCGWSGLKDQAGLDVAYSTELILAGHIPFMDLMALCMWSIEHQAASGESREKKGNSGNTPGSKPSSGIAIPEFPTA